MLKPNSIVICLSHKPGKEKGKAREQLQKLTAYFCSMLDDLEKQKKKTRLVIYIQKALSRRSLYHPFNKTAFLLWATIVVTYCCATMMKKIGVMLKSLLLMTWHWL